MPPMNTYTITVQDAGYVKSADVYAYTIMGAIKQCEEATEYCSDYIVSITKIK